MLGFMGLLVLNMASPMAFADESVQAMINRANDAANQHHYEVAIPLYEKVLVKMPKETVLRNNLAILYASQGVALQEKGQFDAALKSMDQGLALLQKTGGRQADIANVQAAKAGVYFAQASQMLEKIQASASGGTPDTPPPDYPRIRDLLQHAIALDPKNAVFKRAMADSYLAEAYPLAQAQKFTEAQSLLEKGLTFTPDNADIKTSLAHVYLGLAQAQPEQRDQWIAKATTTDNSPRIQTLVARITATNTPASPPENVNNNSGADSLAGKLFAKIPHESKAVAPAELSHLSLTQMIQDMETQLQLKPDPQATLISRLDNVEEQVYGKPQKGTLAERSKAAYMTLLGNVQAGLGNFHLVQAPPKDANSTYLGDIFEVTDGKVVRWGKFPLRIYFEPPDKSLSHYQAGYKDAVLKGFTVWKTQTDGFVNFVEVQNRLMADILVTWRPEYVDRFASRETAPAVYKTYTPLKRSKWLTALQMAAMFTSGYFSLAPQAVNAAVMYHQEKKLQILRDESTIHLGLAPAEGLPPDAANRVIQNMAAKEFGHALGLKGSSNHPGDLLYPELRSDIVQVPSQRDLMTLRELYDRPANIVLNTR